MCFRSELFEKVAIFDALSGRVDDGGQAGEEAELCLRLRQEIPDMKVVFDPCSRIRHKVPVGRARWRYLAIRSYQEGISKARIRHLTKLNTDNPLQSEKKYLRHLVFRSIPSRLLRFWRPSSVTQVAAIVICISAAGAGYLAGNWQNRQVKSSDR